jgi:subtilisin family serine protease
MRKTLKSLALVTGAGLALSAAGTAVADSYMVVGKGNKIRDGLIASIEAQGGTVTRTIPEVGIVVVESDSADFLSKTRKLAGVQSAMHDIQIQWVPVQETVAVTAEEYGNPPASGDDDFFFDLQWGHDAIDAPEAWNAGYRGAGVRVAVIDGGFDLDHPDLAPNINLGLSMNFVPGEELQYGFADTFSHGTHTAGTIAAADNAFGTIGVAPEAELVLVKSLSDAGSGAFSWIIAGIVHAANADADVISMSLGASIPRKCEFEEDDGSIVKYPSWECAALLTATHSAITYAYQSGATVIASIGNDGANLNKDKSNVEIPGQGPHHLGISATGPFLWGANPDGFLDYLAIYSNYGTSGVDLAAPGGDYYGAFFDAGFEDCTVAGLTRPCYVFDYVFSTGNGGWYWSVGTSMAAPHAAGVAALIIGKNGGSMHPAQVIAKLKSSADDLGKPGKDDYYGNGRVNAFKAVQ